MLCPPVYITQAGGGVLAVAHITCATPSSVKRDSPVLPTRLLPAGKRWSKISVQISKEEKKFFPICKIFCTFFAKCLKKMRKTFCKKCAEFIFQNVQKKKKK